MRNFFRPFFVSAVAAIGLLGLTTAPSFAEWPKDKPITVIFPFAAGADYLARLVSAELEKQLGQQVIFENKPGAGGVTGTGFAARQAPDGYTLVMAYPGPAANYTNTFSSLPYKPLDGFEHITQICYGDMVLVARKDFPANTLQELIDYAKANPNKVSAGNNGIGSYGQMIELALGDKAGFQMKVVPYKGSAPIVTDMLSGNLDLSIDYLGEAYIKHIQSGAIKALGVVSAKRSAILPETPTFVESGVDLVAVPWAGIMAPKGTPREVVDKINGVLADYLATDEAKAKFSAVGQTPAPTTPEGFQEIVVKEEALWRDLIKKYNIRND